MHRLLHGLAYVAILSAPVLAMAQPADDPHRPSDGRTITPEVYGTLQTGIYNLGPDDMAARLAGWDNFRLINNGFADPEAADSSLLLSGPIHLDNGVLLESATIFFSDTNTVEPLAGNFFRANTTGNSESIADIPFPAGAPGNQSVTIVFPPGTVIDNENYHYSLNISLYNDGANGNHRFYRARINYRRQVSPDPAFSTFNDVLVGHQFHRFIEALAAAGITGGCSAVPPLYCPDEPVTRGQMAAFLSIALGLHFPN